MTGGGRSPWAGGGRQLSAAMAPPSCKSASEPPRSKGTPAGGSHSGQGTGGVFGLGCQGPVAGQNVLEKEGLLLS